MKGGKQMWSCPGTFPAVALPTALLDMGACAKSTESPLASLFPFEYSEAFFLLGYLEASVSSCAR